MSQLGIIVHWGIYSVPAYDDLNSVRRRRTQNGSEWYLRRLTEKGTFRPISGWKETQTYHQQNYIGKSYDEFGTSFEAESKNYSPDTWMKLCKALGAEYIILTAKHHDGYRLWPTSTGQCSQTDFLLKFKESAIANGLKFGFYYSWFEFGRTCTKDFMNNIVTPQMNELIKYQPDFWWFDGDWEIKTKYAQQIVDQCIDKIKVTNPNAVVNDRIGHKDQKIDPNWLGKSDYRVYSDREIPQNTPQVPWKHINTIGYSWGRNRCQEEKDYKSLAELHSLYKQVSDKKGRFLLNIGPNSDGSICIEESERIIELGKLIRQLPSHPIEEKNTADVKKELITSDQMMI